MKHLSVKRLLLYEKSIIISKDSCPQIYQIFVTTNFQKQN